jgi:hypothetical protein
MSTRERIVAEIKKLGEKLGRAPSQAEFRREARISWHQVYKHFRGMRGAVRAAGLEPGPKGGPLNEQALVLDWARVVRELGRLPSRAEYDARGKHHSVTLHARVGWHQMGHRLVLLLREFHLETEWKDVEQIVVRKYPLLQQIAVSKWPLAKPFTAEDAEGAKENRVAADLRRKAQTAWVTPPRAPQPQRAKSWPVGGPCAAPHEHGNPMRLGKVVAAALAIEILVAAERSIQQSASTASRDRLSDQQKASHWQLANSSWQDQDQNQTPEPQRTLRKTEGEIGAETEAESHRRNTEVSVRLPAVAQGRLGTTEAEIGGEIEAESHRRNTEVSVRLSAVAQGMLRTTEAEIGTEAQAERPGQTVHPVVYGEPLGLAAMAHAPTNEDGVLFLFGVVAPELGFRVERIQRAFPDVEAKREVAPGRWERQLWELEMYSRNFKEHKHDPTRCHGIICWKHNWPDVPEWLEVIELSRVVKGRQS